MNHIRKDNVKMALTKRKKKRLLTGIIGFLIIALGLVALNYPYMSGVLNRVFAYREAEVYKREIQEADTNELDERIEVAHEYNEALAMGKNLNSYKDFSLLQEGAMLGYVEIPQSNVYLAVRYSVSNEVLKHGLGLVEDSSLPVGGESTHAVISGHTGMASKKILTDLTQMKEGDIFFLHVMGLDMAYQVDQVIVVEPWDASELQIVPEEDYVTLLTCTPYGVNSHRLLVRGTRIEYDFTVPVEEVVTEEPRISEVERTRIIIAYISAAVFLLLLIFVIIYIIDPGRKKKKASEKKLVKSQIQDEEIESESVAESAADESHDDMQNPEETGIDKSSVKEV